MAYPQLRDIGYLQAAIAAGKNNRDISNEIGCTDSAVGKALARHGLQTNRRKIEITKDILTTLIMKEHLTLSEIARIYQKTPNGVKYLVNKWRIPFVGDYTKHPTLLKEALQRAGGSIHGCALLIGRTPRRTLNILLETGLRKTGDNPSSSDAEKALAAFCLSLGKNGVCNYRHKRDTWDIYFPEEKLAIELDGFYWHSEGVNKEKLNVLRKLNKTKSLLEARSLHFLDLEWIGRRAACESIIRAALGCPAETVFARKTSISKISPKTSKDFLEENHLQGSAGAKVHYGMYIGPRLIGVASFGKSRYSGKAEWEWVRLCFLSGIKVVGGASKLFKYFVNDQYPKSVVSYSHRRLFTGGVYEKVGFIKKTPSSPGYVYSKHSVGIVESRMGYQKKFLKDKLKSFDPALTEYENMLNNGYRRVWDAGNDVYVWNAT